MTIPITGKWLWIGATSFTDNYDAYDAICAKAEAMGCTGIHPKAADGCNIWYDTAGLKLLYTLAEKHHLKVIPYHYVYGGANIPQEAYITSMLGSIFGGVIPDMEDEYFGQTVWAAQYGSFIRDKHHFTGLVLPTTYANIGQKNLPMVEISKWADGWMPQAYFSMWQWTPGVMFTAQQAITYLTPEWNALDAQLHEQNIQPKPILPIISLGGIDVAEVHAWAEHMAGYEYCGFWHIGIVEPYRECITSLSLAPPVRPSSPPPSVQKEEIMTPLQSLKPEQLEAMWKALVPTLAWNPTFAIEKDWIEMVQTNQPIGHPKHSEAQARIGGRVFNYITFSSGWIIYYDIVLKNTFHMFLGAK